MKGSYLRKRSISPGARLDRALWKIFSLYIKIRDNWTCFTCDTRAQGKQMGVGHFIEDAVGGVLLRFHERNNHAQCEECNCYKNGAKKVYEKRMEEIYGEHAIPALRSLIHKTEPDFDYHVKTMYYKKQVDNMQTFGPMSSFESIGY